MDLDVYIELSIKMTVREAVQVAKLYVAEIYDDEPIRHIGVEEVKLDEQESVWKVTIGFFRPWDEPLGLSEGLESTPYGKPVQWRKRSFKVVEVDDSSGKVRSMTHRSLES